MQKLLNAVEKNRALMADAADYIWKNPETGYKEYKTSAYLEQKFNALGYDLVKPAEIPGFYAVLDTDKPGPTVLVLGEIDSIICPSHPERDKVTGAVHSCGHHIQSATLLGVAAALKEEGVTDELCGKIKLCAVPAEELLEIEFRESLIKEGKIKYFGGKPEFMRRGYFDDVDVAFMVHATACAQSRTTLGSVGCIAKRIIYKGFAAHAGGSPQNGKNAFYAATCGINACNAIRETFEEKDVIRFHPIMTHGGSMVNAIPERAEIETYIRGMNFEAIAKINKRINQALTGAALSLDNNIEIVDRPGYAPNINDKNMLKLSVQAFALANPELPFEETSVFGSGSTDMGDLSCVIPTVHPYIAGSVGTGHGNNYYTPNADQICVNSARWQVVMLHELLKDGGAKTKKIKEEFKPRFDSIKSYLNYMDSLQAEGDRIIYTDGKAEVKI